MSVYTGEYFEHTTAGTSKGIYYSFTPRSLMDDSFYTADEELFSLLVEAHRALGVLEGMVANMPDADVLAESAMLKECYFSRLIDYPGVSLHSLLESRGSGEDTSAVQNVVYAYGKTFDKNLDINQLFEIYTIAKDGLHFDKRKGLREEPFFLADTVTNIQQYNPTSPEHIFPALEDIFLYLAQSNVDILIKAALTHYQLEMIHPFDSYNGIVGRILALKVMVDGGLRAAPYLSLSESLYESKNDYFDLLSSTQKGGGYARWIKFFVGTVHNAAQRGIEQIQRYRQIVKHDEEKIRQSQQFRVHNVLAVFEYWKRYMVSNIKQPMEKLQLSYSAVERSIAAMSELGILKQVTNTPRYRKYVYSERIGVYLGMPKQSGVKTDKT